MIFLQKFGLQRKKASLRRAGRNKTGGIIAITACVFALAIMTAGCGKTEEPVPIDLSAGNLEEMQGDGAGDADESTEGDSAIHSENNTAQEDAKEGGNSKNQTEAGTKDDGAAAQDAQAVGSTQLEGDVRSVDADSFVICKSETWEEDDFTFAVAAAPGYEEESDLITIHTSQNCVYQYKTVKNGGVNPEDVSTRDGSFADIKEELAVTVIGSWQDDGSFLADSVVLMEFV